MPRVLRPASVTARPTAASVRAGLTARARRLLSLDSDRGGARSLRPPWPRPVSPRRARPGRLGVFGDSDAREAALPSSWPGNARGREEGTTL